MKSYQEFISEAKKCWPGYKKKGTQKLFGKTYNRCVKEDIVSFAKRQEKKGKGTGPKPTRTPKELIDLAKRLEKKEEYELEEEGYKERPIKRMMKKAMDIVNKPDYEGSSEDVWRHNQIIKHTVKNKGGGKQRKKAQHNIDKYWDRLDRGDELEEGYELEESSMGERSGRRTRGKVTLARGRGADMDRKERTTAAIAKKAGLKGTGKYSTKDLRTKAKDYTTYDSEDTDDDYGSTEQDHYIRTHSSARKATKGEHLIKKYKFRRKTPAGHTKIKTAPSSESVRRVRDLKKQMTKAGANKRGPVHTVDIMHRDSDVGKGDPDRQMERGRNFIQALKDTPKHLKAAGAKKGEAVIGKPTAVMSGEDQKTGVAKRAKLYKKVFGKRSSKKSEKTGLMTGKVD